MFIVFILSIAATSLASPGVVTPFCTSVLLATDWRDDSNLSEKIATAYSKLLEGGALSSLNKEDFQALDKDPFTLAGSSTSEIQLINEALAQLREYSKRVANQSELRDLLQSTAARIFARQAKEKQEIDRIADKRANPFLVPVTVIRSGGYHVGVELTPDLGQLVSASQNQKIRIWDSKTGKQLRELDWEGGMPRSMSLSTDGRWLAIGRSLDSIEFDEAAVLLWDLNDPSNRKGWAFPAMQNFKFPVMKFSNDSERLIISTAKEGLRVVDLNRMKLRTLAGADVYEPSSRNNFTLCDHHAAVFLRKTAEIALIDIDSGQVVRNIPLSDIKDIGVIFESVEFSPDGQQFVLQVAGSTILQFRNSITAELIREIDTGHERTWSKLSGNVVEKRILDYNFSHNGLWLATSGVDGQVKVWDVETGKLLLQLPEHSPRADLAVFSSDDSLLVTASADSLRIWNLERVRDQE